MNIELSERRASCQEAPAVMSSLELNVVLATARSLQYSAQSGQAQTPLRAKNLGLLCDAPDSPEAQRFCQAAEGLGAHVALIRPLLSELGTPEALQHTARVLGRLYDAVECQGMPHDLVQQLERDADIPVFEGLACDDHPTAQLAALLSGPDSDEEKRCFVLQAALVHTLG